MHLVSCDCESHVDMGIIVVIVISTLKPLIIDTPWPRGVDNYYLFYKIIQKPGGARPKGALLFSLFSLVVFNYFVE